MVFDREIDRSEQLRALVQNLLTRHGRMSVQDLLVRAHEYDDTISLDEIRNIVHRLDFEDEIAIQRPAATFLRALWLNYTEPLPMLRLAAMFLALLSVAVTPDSLYSGIPRIVGGIVFLLFSPGNAAAELLFSRSRLDSAEIAALSVGLSVIITPLAALFLNFVIGRLDIVNLVIVLSLFTTCLSLFSTAKKFLQARVEKAEI